MKILAVDDDESILEILRHVLGGTGYHEVETARSAKHALETISDEQRFFDCFLIDIQMPSMDGIDLTGLIRQTPGYRHKPVLMLTAMEDKHYLDRAFAAGATDYITKPFDFLELRARLHEAQRLTHDKLHHDFWPNMDETMAQPGTQPGSGQVEDRTGESGALIDYAEFENYLIALGRRKACKAILIAFKIRHSRRDFPKHSPESLAIMVPDVAISVQQALSGHLSSLSYRGDGTFVCVLEKPLNAFRDEIEDMINTRIASLPRQDRKSSVRVVAGDQVSLKTISPQNLFKLLWHAVDSVEQRHLSANEFVSISKRFLSRALLSDEQRRLDQKAYRSVLKETLPEVNDTQWHQRLAARKTRTG